jgi:O-antigen ligase
MAQKVLAVNNLNIASHQSFILSKIAVVVVCLFLVLQRFIAYMGFPPLYGGEITIILFVIFFLRPSKLHSFFRGRIAFVYITYLLVAFFYIFTAYNDVGIDCMRYAAVSYYAVFIYFGYAVLYTRFEQRFFIDALYYAILLSNCHTLLALFTPIRQLGPVINGVPMFGNLDQASIYNVLALPYLLIFWPKLRLYKSIPLGILGFLGFIFWGSRAGMLSMIGLLVLLLIFRKVWQQNWIKNIPLFGFILILLSLFIITFSQNTRFIKSLQMQTDIVTSIWSDSPNLQGKIGSKQHRIRMWKEVIAETIDSDPLFGQGYRDKLVDVEFFHPHNSFITFFGRIGFVGLSLVILIYFGIPIGIAKRIMIVKDKDLQKYLLFYLCFITSCILVSLTSPTFESPYSALVCNFVFGGALRLHCLAHDKPQSQKQRTFFLGDPVLTHC